MLNVALVNSIIKLTEVLCCHGVVDRIVSADKYIQYNDYVLDSVKKKPIVDPVSKGLNWKTIVSFSLLIID